MPLWKARVVTLGFIAVMVAIFVIAPSIADAIHGR
jgi:hypothetical protein